MIIEEQLNDISKNADDLKDVFKSEWTITASKDLLRSSGIERSSGIIETLVEDSLDALIIECCLVERDRHYKRGQLSCSEWKEVRPSELTISKNLNSNHCHPLKRKQSTYKGILVEFGINNSGELCFKRNQSESKVRSLRKLNNKYPIDNETKTNKEFTHKDIPKDRLMDHRFSSKIRTNYFRDAALEFAHLYIKSNNKEFLDKAWAVVDESTAFDKINFLTQITSSDPQKGSKGHNFKRVGLENLNDAEVDVRARIVGVSGISTTLSQILDKYADEFFGSNIRMG